MSGLRLGGALTYVFNFEYDFSGTMQLPPPLGPTPVSGRSESYILVQQYSAEYVWKSLTLQAEYQNLAIFGERHMAEIPFVAPASTSVDNSRSDSWYVSAAYRFNKWVEAGMYYTEYYSSTRDRDGDNAVSRSDASQKDWAFLSLRFDPTDWLILKAEGHYIRGTALLHDAQRNPDRDSDGWFMFATKATVSF